MKTRKHKSTTERLGVSRELTRNRAEEALLLVSILTRGWKYDYAHLAPAAKTSPSDTWTHAVCIHSEDYGCLAWRISDENADAIFRHLARHECGAPIITREQKLARMRMIAEERRA